MRERPALYGPGSAAHKAVKNSPRRVLSNEGALLEASLKWDRATAWPGRGNPSRPDAAPADVPRKHGLGRPWVSVRAHYGALPLARLDGDRHAARNRRGLPR